MWLITPTGFFSIVCKPDDVVAGTLTIRARVRSDLEALKSVLPSLGQILEGAGTDYRFRARAKRADVAAALSEMVQSLGYDNFKSEVARRQGQERAHVYGEVWNVLHSLQEAGWDALTKAFGGIVLNGTGQVLLRRPSGDFDGYVWTFPKGRPEPWETGEEAAIREVGEETGYDVEITSKLPGRYRGGTTETEYFLMSPVRKVREPDESETGIVRWVDLEEAKNLLSLTRNELGRLRDLSVLRAVRATLNRVK